MTDYHDEPIRVRGILLTGRGSALFIRRKKPGLAPYTIAAGGGVEYDDADDLAALHRELMEELGAEAEVIGLGFTLDADDDLPQRDFYLCRLIRFDNSLRSGPEFDNPEHGEYIPLEIALEAAAIEAANIKPGGLRDYLLANLDMLRAL